MKTHSSMLHVRMDTEMKERAIATLAAMGLTASEAVRLLFHRIAVDQTFPLELKVPNAETRNALVEVDELVKTQARFVSADDPDGNEARPDLSRITELELEIRELVNAPRKHRAIREDSATYDKLCSCLDVIGDTELAFRAHEEMPDDPRPGSSYLLVYGFLQALVLQQDAVRNLCEALGLPSEPDPELKEVREIRNDAVGHPTNRRGGKSFSHISRPTMSSAGFELMTFEPGKWAPMSRFVNLRSLLETQQTQLEKALAAVVQALRREEMKHRQQFRDEKLVALFPSVLSYYFEKVSEAVHGSRSCEYGAIHLELIGEVVEKVRAALERRGIDGAYPGIEYKLEQLEYPLAQLREYFAEKGEGRLNADDAQIFTSFVYAGMSKLQETARELDDGYAAEL